MQVFRVVKKEEEEDENEVEYLYSVPPSDIATMPSTKIVFNAPFYVKNGCNLEIKNESAVSRIAFVVMANSPKIHLSPKTGVLDPKEKTVIAVSCDAFAYGQEDTNNDRITIEWTNTPDGAAKEFRREWFQVKGVFRDRVLPIEYNA